jgi:Domain of unknown function (DUF5667)
MGEKESRRDISRLERRISRSLGGSAARDKQSDLEQELINMMVSGGPELPVATGVDDLKTAYMERGASLRERVVGEGPESVGQAATRRVLNRHAFARIAVAMTVVLGLMLGISLGTAFAMPGNPLYSVKRAAEDAYVSLVPGDENKADTYASYANRRIDELKYAEDRGLSKWYYSLARDTERSIEEADGRANRLGSAAANGVKVRVRGSVLRLEGLLSGAFNGMTQAERGNIERGLVRARERLRMGKRAPGGSSQQPVQPGGLQNTAPGGQQSQPGTQQQVQPGQPGTQQQEQPGQPGTQQQGQPGQPGTQQQWQPGQLGQPGQKG